MENLDEKIDGIIESMESVKHFEDNEDLLLRLYNIRNMIDFLIEIS